MDLPEGSHEMFCEFPSLELGKSSSTAHQEFVPRCCPLGLWELSVPTLSALLSLFSQRLVAGLENDTVYFLFSLVIFTSFSYCGQTLQRKN